MPNFDLSFHPEIRNVIILMYLGKRSLNLRRKGNPIYFLGGILSFYNLKSSDSDQYLGSTFAVSFKLKIDTTSKCIFFQKYIL